MDNEITIIQPNTQPTNTMKDEIMPQFNRASDHRWKVSLCGNFVYHEDDWSELPEDQEYTIISLPDHWTEEDILTLIKDINSKK